MVLFDAPMGDWNGGDRGLAAVPGREAEFRASLGEGVAERRLGVVVYTATPAAR